MAIFRGPGGSGDATTDSTTQALAAVNAANNAAASATLAASFTPSQTGNSGKYLTTNGTSTSWGSIAASSGTVTSVAATAGTGISVSGSPITSSGTLTITNTAPDQTVALTAGTGITTSGTYPNFTIESSITGMTYPSGTGIAVVSSGTSWGTTLTAPSGSIVGTSDTQTLSGKTLTGTKETIFAITDAAAFEINPANGGIQTITLGANRTPKATNFTAGQSVTLMVTAGANILTWTDTTFGTSGVKWIGATAPGTNPTLSTTAISIIELWKVGTQVYGAFVGVA